ncbi:MAG: hypothetical protein HOV83_08580 [Catenulispora sp.]|nr:hypothetical protein [Catenulispora sp.]
MGVILWYRVQFPEQHLTLSSDVASGTWLVDAEIEVRYEVGQLHQFWVTFRDLPYEVHKSVTQALARKPKGDGVPVVINLGYLDTVGGVGAGTTVLDGYVDGVQYPRDSPASLGVRMTGYEKAAFKLLNTPDGSGAQKMAHISGEKQSPIELAEQIAGSAGLKLATRTDPRPDLTAKLPAWAKDAPNTYQLLQLLAADCDAEVLVQDGEVQFGSAVQSPAKAGLFPAIPDPGSLLALLTGEDSLIAVKGVQGARLAEFRPMTFGGTSQGRVVTDQPPKADVRTFDFTALGTPGMRAGQRVIASVEGYDDPFSPFRILHVTHSFSPTSGYVCRGRAAVFLEDGTDQDGGSNRKNSEKARAATAAAIGDRIRGLVKDAQITHPAVDVGRVKAARADQRLASLHYRPEPALGKVSPSVQADVPAGEAVLLSKPMAAPFAWHRVGLSVPVYAGMRALLNQVRDSRDDTVVTGYLWAQTPAMEPPKAHDGDWWLCLPTELGGDPPLPVGKTANDLTAADGRRVIEAAGLQITVGKDACSPVGTRPQEGPADVFLIRHKTGTAVRIDDHGDVTITVGGTTLTVGRDGVAIS